MISNSESKGAIVSKKIDDFNAEDRVGVKLLETSVHFLIGEIEEDNINECIKWIVYENLTPKEDKVLTLYINSQGGDLYQALGLIDIMNNSMMPIRTIGYGSIMSAGFLIMSSGTKGERYLAQNTGVMCHQFSGDEGSGKYHDLKAARKENERLNQAMYDILKNTTGLDGRVIKNKLLSPTDLYMSAEEMIEFGAADHILGKE
jgi:ATP-dependent Clp protease protease subunit